MASRHHSLDLSELKDVTDLLVGFEDHNNVEIQASLTVERTKKGPTLVVSMMAELNDAQQSEAKPLVFLSVRCSDMNLKTLMGALTHALYAMDFQLALNEFEATKPKKA